MKSKHCTKCGEEKPESEFLHTKDRRYPSGFRNSPDCKDCHRDAIRIYHHRVYKAPDRTQLKECSRCKKVKPHSGFSPSCVREDGLQVRCRACTLAMYSAEYAPVIVDGVTLLYCPECETRKPEREMVTGKGQRKCKSCQAAYMKRWYARSLGRALRERTQAMPEDGLIAMTCTRCKVFRPIADFYYKGRRYARKCKHCHHEDQLAYRKENRQAIHDRQRDRRYRKNYNMTLEDKLAMIEAQGGKCAICRDPLDDPRKIHIDHCHTDGRVRGILCMYCNQAVGGFRDDPERMRRAIEYVTRLT